MNSAINHVLLIEDNPGDADLVRLRLGESNPSLEVSCVSRLEDGIASLQAQPSSLVLLDLNLPDSHGAETFRKLLEKAPDVPVVILSGQDDEGLAAKALHQGAQDYLVKGSVTSAALDRAMRYAIERQALLRSLEMSRKQQLEFKNQFLSHVSHELRTPLSCIHQYVTLLLDGLAGEITAEQRDHLNIILKSANQLGSMVWDLLEAARAESGKISLDLRCVPIDDVVHLAATMTQAAAWQKGIRIEAAVEDSIPYVLGDPDRILEIIVNLLDNAVKFSQTYGTVTLRAFRVPSDPDFVCVSVTDTGSGIKPEARSLIFERLYQDPDAVDNHRKGLGLGLFISKELVRLHGGRIWVASDGASSSTFSFTLPLYSLPKLLFPLITQENQLRQSLVLVRVGIRPRTAPPRGNWKEICSRTRELLERCVCPDKDLVLPPMAASGPEQTLFIVASTDMSRVPIMVARMRGQMEKLEGLTANGEFEMSAVEIPLPGGSPDQSLDEQVRAVADRVTAMVQAALVPTATLQEPRKVN